MNLDLTPVHADIQDHRAILAQARSRYELAVQPVLIPIQEEGHPPAFEIWWPVHDTLDGWYGFMHVQTDGMIVTIDNLPDAESWW